MSKLKPERLQNVLNTILGKWRLRLGFEAKSSCHRKEVSVQLLRNTT